MQIQRFTFNMIEENTYLLWDDSREAAIVDCGAFFPEEQRALQDFIAARGLRVRRSLLTHAHFDHLFGCQFLYDSYGVRPEMHAAEATNYACTAEQVAMFIHRHLPVPVPPAGEAFADGTILNFGHTALRVIHTPGHTPGGVCFDNEDGAVLLSGDTLFRRSVGRTDLPGGSPSDLLHSIREQLLALPDAVTVLPGHGDATTIGEERAENSYLTY
ncbi:MAG: MBL fold metallo-hydrolase [Alloprevotella sp.]|nr:MBL fold metallo-hydrolase [Alloprevotella sp.]